MERCHARRQRWNITVLVHRLGNTNSRQGCVWTEADRQMEGQIREKERKKKCICLLHHVQETSGQMLCGTPLYVKIEVRVCERQRGRLMDGLVYTARGVQGGGEG